jgi:hypothetical protein
METKTKVYTSQLYAEILDAGTTSFEIDINCPFTPTEIKISNLASDAFPPTTTPVTPKDDNVYVLSSDLIQSLDGRIGAFSSVMAIMTEPAYFQNSRPVSGTYKFTLDDELDQLTILTFTMTFIRN